MSKTGNYNVYTRNPAINKPEFTQIAGLKHEPHITINEESEAARMARKRLYGRREAEERPRHISKAQIFFRNSGFKIKSSLINNIISWKRISYHIYPNFLSSLLIYL